MKLWYELRGVYKSKVQSVQMNNLRGLLDTKRSEKIKNESIKELCGVALGANNNK